MPISIGDALLKVGVDTRDMDKGLQGLGNKVKQHQKAIGLSMAAMGGAVLAAGALSIKTFAEMGDEVAKMARKTGFSTEALSELRHVAEISGTNIEGLDKATKRMSKTITDASEGMATYIRAFERIGLSAEELIGLSPEEQFMKIGQAIADLEDPTLRAATAQDIFGRAGMDLIPMFDEGREKMDELRQEAHDLGIVFDKEAAAKAEEFTDAMHRVDEATSGLKMAIAEQLVPVLIPLINKVKDVISGMSEWMKEHPKLTKVIVIGTAALGLLLIALGSLLMLMPGLTAAMGAFGISFHVALGPIGLVTGAITALVAAGVLLWKYWDKVAHFFKDLWSNIKIIFATAVKYLVKTVMQPFFIYVDKWIGTLIRGLGKIVGFFNKDWAESIEGVADTLANLDDEIVEWADNLIENERAIKSNRDALRDFKEAQEEAKEAVEDTEIATEELSEEVEDLTAKYDDYIESVKELIEAEEFAKTEAGKLGLTVDDLKKHMIAAGRAAELLALSYEDWLEIGEDVNKFIEHFGINLEDLAETSEMTTDDMLRDISDLTREAKDAARDRTRKEIDAIDERMDAHRDAHQERMDALQEEYDAVIKTIDAELDYALRGYESQIDAIDRQIEAINEAQRGRQDAERKAELEASIAEETDADRRADLEDSLNELLIQSGNKQWQEERKLAYKALITEEKDAEERGKLEQELADFLLGVQEERTREQLENHREALRQEMEMAREQARNAKERAKEEYDYRRKLEERKYEDLMNRLQMEKRELDRALEEQLQRYDEELEAFRSLLEDESKDMEDFVDYYNELVAQLEDKTVTVTVRTVHTGGGGGGGGGGDGDGGDGGGGGGGGGIIAIQKGGIAMRPMLARISEQAPRNPEAIIPLDRLERILGGGAYRTANIYVMLDERVLAEALEQRLVDDIRIRTGARI